MAVRRLGQCGAVTIDADKLSREVVEPGTRGLREVVAAFGEEVLGADGSLDRSALGQRVFADDAARRRLEDIVHPRVRERTLDLVRAAPPSSVVVNDVPLLVEVGLAAMYHLVIVVEAPESTRIARLVGDRGMSESQAYARIRAQASDERRRAAADVLLRNDGDIQDLTARVDRLWKQRLLPFEENVRLRRPARPNGGLSVVPYDPAWPQQYARLAARISGAAGMGRLDHVGPTAVPGQPAPDVIDIRLTVATQADADRIGGVLAEAGFPRVDSVGDQSPEPVPTRVSGTVPTPGIAGVRRRHASADPGRLARLEVCSA